MRNFASGFGLQKLKQLWLVLVAVALVWYLFNNGTHLRDVLSQTSLWKLGFALAGIFVGKMCAFLLMARSLSLVGSRNVGFLGLLWIYSSADVAKYMPGGVWAVVGRLIHYKDIGLSAGSISKALLFENVGFAAAALFVMIPAGLFFLGEHFGPNAAMAVAIMVAACLIIGLVVLVYVARRWFASVSTSRPWLPLLLMGVGWLAMGTSFFILLPIPFSPEVWLWFVGVYATSFVAGMAAVFAPAGAGVREGLLLISAGVVGVPGAVVLDSAILNRGLWVLADILLFSLAFLLRRFLNGR